jgi:flavodoxin
MHRTLVTYFSRTGRTRRIALEIAHALNAESEQIEESRSRLGFIGYWRSGREAYREIAAPIAPCAHDPSSYELVVLGTPIWAGRMSSPLRAYVNAHAGSFRRVAFFCTHGGTSAARVFDAIAALCGARPVATLAVTEREIKAEAYTDRLQQFVARLAAVEPA